MDNQGFFISAAAIIPVLLLVLATEERLGLVKREWRQAGPLHLIATLIGGLIVAEVVALGAVRRQSNSIGLVAYVAIVVAAALGLTAWGIGWSIWARYPDDVPAAGSFAKCAFYGVGLLTIAGLIGATWWTLH